MLDQFADEEKIEIQMATDYLERKNTEDTRQVLEVIGLCMTVIEDQGIEIDNLKEKLKEKDDYIEDWGMY